jgi:hypothetical protein
VRCASLRVAARAADLLLSLLHASALTTPPYLPPPPQT